MSRDGHSGSTLSAISEMLPRVLPETIQVTINAAPDLPPINADAGMMEQMLMNLAVNARDAMPEGGRLTISAEAVEVTAALAQNNQDARPGRFLCLSVTDTGCGMAPDVLSHIFEPFFTTKAVGKGTGLGLATVYGIVKQHEGWVEVQSQPGQGTTFRIFIPTCTSSRKPTPPRRRRSRCAAAAKPFWWWRMKRPCASMWSKYCVPMVIRPLPPSPAPTPWSAGRKTGAR